MIIINTSTASARDVVVGGITTVLFLLKPLRRGAWVREQERGQAYKGDRGPSTREPERDRDQRANQSCPTTTTSFRSRW